MIAAEATWIIDIMLEVHKGVGRPVEHVESLFGAHPQRPVAILPQPPDGIVTEAPRIVAIMKEVDEGTSLWVQAVEAPPLGTDPEIALAIFENSKHIW